ncbi:hypothetical protein DENSPDRAFT_840765 [Dentipellis sp. KUC8613]|nr:hypothetical protein DENSPDRAFT_840765 [Dentipellis sp. KUC8613]
MPYSAVCSGLTGLSTFGMITARISTQGHREWDFRDPRATAELNDDPSVESDIEHSLPSTKKASRKVSDRVSITAVLVAMIDAQVQQHKKNVARCTIMEVLFERAAIHSGHWWQYSRPSCSQRHGFG